MTGEPKVFLKETTAIQRIEKILDQLTPNAAARVLSFVADRSQELANKRFLGEAREGLDRINNGTPPPNHGAGRFA